MSNYKLTLQSNNEALSANNLDLQNLIDKANNLPDAGSSGGNSVEYCELTIQNRNDMSDIVFIIPNNNNSFDTKEVGMYGDGEGKVNCIKNSIIYMITDGYFIDYLGEDHIMNLSGNIKQTNVARGSTGGNSINVFSFLITDDATINIYLINTPL